MAISGWDFLTPEQKAELQQYAPNTSNAKRVPTKPRLTKLMSEVQLETVDWLWTNRVPRGRLVLFDGDPGVGKSYASLAIAAAISKGEALPYDQEPEAPLRSLILSAEDGPADTIGPRLHKLGADMNMIAIPDGNFQLSQIKPPLIETMLQEHPAALVVIDPVIAFAGGRDTDRANQVRELLGGYATLAEKYKTAVVLIRHLNKSTQSKALYRGQGSIDFAAVCRAAFIFSQDPNNPGRRLMAQTKSSLGGFQPTLEYFIDDAGNFRWGVESSETADEALGTGEPSKQRDARELNRAADFLQRVLQKGPMASKDVREHAAQAGIAWRTVWRAKDALNIKAWKARGASKEWYWEFGD